MIIINVTENAEAGLTTVSHFTRAEDAAQALFLSVYEVAKAWGGEVQKIERDGGFGVTWDGADQWADAYVVQDGADARQFAAEAHDSGRTVLFVDLD